MPAATARKPTSRHPVGARLSADDRRAQVLKAAVAEFALKGLEGTSTELIAKRAGISQPYIFRLFPSKKDLFLAAVGQCFKRVEEAFAVAARKAESMTAAERLHVMGHTYLDLLRQREWLMMQMQSYVACFDPDVRSLVRQGWARLHDRVAALSGASDAAVEQFFAMGMLCTVQASMGLPAKEGAHAWLHSVAGA